VNGPVTLLWGLERDRYNHRKVLCDSAVGQGVEALLQALEEAGGDPGERGERLRAALGALEIELLGVPRRVDGNGQAVVSATLVRVAPEGGGLSTLRPLRTIAEVDQSVGNLLDAEHRPGALDETCEAGEPPPWAR